MDRFLDYLANNMLMIVLPIAVVALGIMIYERLEDADKRRDENNRWFL